MAEELKEFIEEASKKIEQPPAGGAETAEGRDPLIAEIKGTMKDVAEQLEKNPMAAKVLKRVRATAEEADKSEFATQMRKAMKDTAEGIEKSPLWAAAHRVLLAAIGAAALAQDEIEDFVARLVERGQIAEADGKKILKDVLEKRKTILDKTGELAEAPKRAVDEVEKRIEEAMARMNIPTKDEIETLSAKITALTKKVEELKKQD